MPFRLRSPAFEDGSTIPVKYTLDGENLSPPLEWENPPEGTRSFALIIEDPDAPQGTFRHWGICNIPASRHRLPEGAGTENRGPTVNDFGNRRYDGPEPPKGHGVHHYHFCLAALDVEDLRVPEDAKVEDLWKAAEPHILDETELMGTYERH